MNLLDIADWLAYGIQHLRTCAFAQMSRMWICVKYGNSSASTQTTKKESESLLGGKKNGTDIWRNKIGKEPKDNWRFICFSHFLFRLWTKWSFNFKIAVFVLSCNDRGGSRGRGRDRADRSGPWSSRTSSSSVRFSKQEQPGGCEWLGEVRIRVGSFSYSNWFQQPTRVEECRFASSNQLGWLGKRRQQRQSDKHADQWWLGH